MKKKHITQINLIPWGSSTIPTLHWLRPGSRATLLFIPGGHGCFGLARTRRTPPIWLFPWLYRSRKIPMDIVWMDQWHPLYHEDDDVSVMIDARIKGHYIEQISKTIGHYKDHRPMFAMGHSNGTLSLARYIHRHGHRNLSAAVFSACHFSADLPSSMNLPSLVLHHRRDPCEVTPPWAADRLADRLRTVNHSNTVQRWVHGGQAVPRRDPVSTGLHMYYKAFEEAASHIDLFLARSLADQI